ncbi:hypothetical protein F5B19DRAFT_227142 [Rostrohypoxylon terebratum]|nr:hypothetical protein F5B19DRAFT_227142 [Rostrohypoxylon terebratum]
MASWVRRVPILLLVVFGNGANGEPALTASGSAYLGPSWVPCSPFLHFPLHLLQMVPGEVWVLARVVRGVVRGDCSSAPSNCPALLGRIFAQTALGLLLICWNRHTCSPSGPSLPAMDKFTD